MSLDEKQPYPTKVALDLSFERGIEQVLALGFWYGLDTLKRLQALACTVSQHNLQVAAFCDLMGRFYTTGQDIDLWDISGQNLVGMTTHGQAVAAVPKMLAAPLSKRSRDGAPVYRRRVATLTDTADPAILLRNQIQIEANRIVLAGPPLNLLELLTMPDCVEIIRRQVEFVVVAAGRFADGKSDPLVARYADSMRTLIARWPTPIVFAGSELGEKIRYPASSIETDFTWTPDHPIVDAYRAFADMPYDAPTQSMAALLYAAIPEGKHFRLSDPGTVSILKDGSTGLIESSGGKHRYLIADAAQTDRIVDLYTKGVSVKPSAPSEIGMATTFLTALLAALSVVAFMCLPALVAGQARDDFDNAVKPVLSVCAQCHNTRMASGDLDVTKLASLDSVLANRDTWERILLRVRAGEMPPPRAARPPQGQLDAMIRFVDEFMKDADRAAAPDPGRVVAHRLNRTEYANTIRDLLGVSFRADKHFPSDDSGDGFDNIGELLNVSPLLMERYLTAAETLARWAVSSRTPSSPLTAAYAKKDGNLAYADRSTAEFTHRIEFSGDYSVLFGLFGARAANPAPVTMGFWVDGQLLHSRTVNTTQDDPNNPYPYEEFEVRVHLPAGDHVFQAGFINDEYVKALPAVDLYRGDTKNKFVDSIILTGPYPSSTQSQSRKKILVCDPNIGRPCLERIIRTLARRAYRRAVTHDEVEALLRFADFAAAHDQPPEERLQAAIEAMLVSPKFLFRLDQGSDPADGASHPVSDFELASRLSYFLWSSMPDDALLDVAETGRLHTPDVLQRQVDRMLSDPKSAALGANFAGQWLETRALDSVSPDPQKFPQWSRELRDAMKRETAEFFQYVVRENRPITDFLDADYTFLNETLAEHYGIAGVGGKEFRRVELKALPVGAQRGGVLSHAGVLTVSSYPNRTSPVLRGRYVLQSILGTPPPPPPGNVPALDEAAIGVSASLREQLEQHRKNPDCASCHSRMDPLGFGLENYDPIGRWRTEDGKFPIDATGTLPDGKTFSSPAEMRRLLVAQLPQFAHNLTGMMLTYALGRGVETHDRPAIAHIEQQLAAHDYRMKTLVYEIVASPPFQYRRGEKAGTQ